jgi:hypothetical protein
MLRQQRLQATIALPLQRQGNRALDQDRLCARASGHDTPGDVCDLDQPDRFNSQNSVFNTELDRAASIQDRNEI